MPACPNEYGDRLSRLEERHNHVIERLDDAIAVLATTNQNIIDMRIESASNKGAHKATLAIITGASAVGGWLISVAAEAVGITHRHP